jgi:hypothetical protein
MGPPLRKITYLYNCNFLYEAPSQRDPLKILPKVDLLPQMLPRKKNGVSLLS